MIHKTILGIRYKDKAMSTYLKRAALLRLRAVFTYQSTLEIPVVSVQKGTFLLSKVQYQVENALANIMSATPLMKNIVQKKPSKFATVDQKCYKIIIAFYNIANLIHFCIYLFVCPSVSVLENCNFLWRKLSSNYVDRVLK